jgi:endoglucanase
MRSISSGLAFLVLAAFTAGCSGPMDEASVDGESASVLSFLGPLSSADIGPVGATGGFTVSNDRIFVSGAGADIWGAADAFQFAHQSFSGDGEIIARVVSQPRTHAWAKAGVMIRESLAAGSRYAFVALTPDNGATLQSRSSTNGWTGQSGLAGIAAPRFVRLVRSGNSFAGSVSDNGTTWTSVGTATVSMPGDVLAGLAVTSHVAGTLATVEFSNVASASSEEPVPVPNTPPSVSLVSPASGASFTAGDSITVSASASDSDGSVAKVEFLAGTLLIGAASKSPFQVVWSGATVGSHQLTARATDDQGASTTSGPISISVVEPAPAIIWTSRDIGSVGATGSFAASGSTITISGSGADIWGTADAFHFASVPMSGDGEVVALVSSQQNTHSWAKAGVMIRESTATGSRHAFMALTPSNGAAFQRRVSANSSSQSTGLSGPKAPYWVRLARAGNLFTGSVSTDGTSWKVVGSATISMSANSLAGLAVTSHSRGTLSKVVFSNVAVGSIDVPPTPEPNQVPTVSMTSPASGSTFKAPASISLAASASDSDGSIAKVEFFSGSTLVGTDTSSPYQASMSNVPAGSYVLSARATDNSGATATSSVSITVASEPPPPDTNPGDLKASVFNATSSSMGVRWTNPSGATSSRIYLAPEPPLTAGGIMPAEKQVSSQSGTATEAQITGLAPAVDVFLRIEVSTSTGVVTQVVHGRTVGGPREPLDNAVRNVHGFAPNVLQVVLFNGDGSTYQSGTWTVTRSNGTAIPVTKVSRQSLPISAPSYQVGWGKSYSDTIIDADHRIFLTLGQNLGGPDLLTVKGPGVSFLLPFSDRYLETPVVQLNQVGYNPRATERYAYVSGWMGDGGSLPLSGFPGTADVLAEPARSSDPRTTLRAGLAITQRSASDTDAGGEVRQINLSSVPAGEGVRLRIRIPGVGVSWPTQVSEIAVFKAFFTVERGLFLNRWGSDISDVMDELPRNGRAHPFAYTSEGTDFDQKFSTTTPLTGKRPLLGGYYDAGDFDQRPMHQVVPQVLLRAYELNPSRYLDNQLDIPESGNGIPDLLDEALWGINAWVALQESDGGVRMGVESTRHPWAFYHATEDPLNYWTYSRCPNASARAAGLFAQASRLLAPFNATRAADLRTRAISAFAYAKANNAAAPFRLYGAGELFRLTGQAQYDSDFQAAWNSMGSYGAFSKMAPSHLLFSDYKNPGQAMPDYILGYVLAPGASENIKSTTSTWLATLADKWSNAVRNSSIAHRTPRPGNYNFDWGVGMGTARFMDNVIARMQFGGLSADQQQTYLNALSLSADYMLGGNPNGMVYFTLLGSRSVYEPLHLDSLAWIKEGFGPAPGVPAYGPVNGLPAASYMDATKAKFHPTFNDIPRGMRYADVRTLVNTNEFSVWEVSGPFVQLFGILTGPNMKAPASWKTGGADILSPLP